MAGATEQAQGESDGEAIDAEDRLGGHGQSDVAAARVPEGGDARPVSTPGGPQVRVAQEPLSVSKRGQGAQELSGDLGGHGAPGASVCLTDRPGPGPGRMSWLQAASPRCPGRGKGSPAIMPTTEGTPALREL